MRILSLRLIVALIIGATLVFLASLWYQVHAEKDQLRHDLERKAETFGESFARLSDVWVRWFRNAAHKSLAETTAFFLSSASIPGFLFFSFQTTIQISRGADEREMSERLRKIPEMFSGCTQFLRVKAERIGIAHEFFKQ
jgi:hypothetical protein